MIDCYCRTRKSQIAVEYCYRFRDRHPDSSVFWINAATRTGFEEGYRAIADAVKISRVDRSNADVLQPVCEWLRGQSRRKWLLVIDSADESVFEDSTKKGFAIEERTTDNHSPPLSKYLPQTGNGFILITSRSMLTARKLTGETTSVLTVAPMSLGEARTLLFTKQANSRDPEDANQLVQALDCIPLAVLQAAAFINLHTPRFTVRKYLQELLRGGEAQLQLLYKDAYDFRRESIPATSIWTTWQLAFDHIRDTAPSAAHLLSLASLFQPDEIQDYLLVQYHDDREANPDHRDESNLQFEEDISILRSYFFITTNEEGDSLVMHKLVQSFVKEWLERVGELERWKEKYLEIMSEAFPKDPYQDWAKCKALFPHAILAPNYRPARIGCLELYTTLLQNTSLFAKVIGNYDVAETMSKSALSCCQTMLGFNDPLTLACTQNRASVLQRRGKYKAAEDMIRLVYDERVKALGPTHSDTLAALTAISSSQDMVEESESIQTQVLKTRQMVLGPEHQDTLNAMVELASILSAKGKIEEAEILETQVVEIRRRVLGLEHPATLSAMTRLATTLFALKKFSEAADIQILALDVSIKIRGVEHPNSIFAMSYLGSIFHALGQYQRAKELLLEASNLLRKGFRGEDPETLLVMSNLASTYSALGYQEEAQKLKLQVLDLSTRVLGEKHPRTELARAQLLEFGERVFKEQQSETNESSVS